MKKQTKNKYIILSILVVIAVIIVGGILAFLTDTDEKINNFKIGNVDIILHEYNWNPDTYTTEDESGEPDAVQTDFGQTVPKDPQVENVGRNPAYIYLKVEVPRASYEDGLTTITNESLFEYEIDDANWTELLTARSVDETGKYNVYYYYYNDILASQNTTTPLFEEITLKDSIPGVEDEVLSVKVTAYAIQANNLPDETTAETTEWAEEFINGAVNQGVSKSIKIAVGDGSLDSYNLELEADETAQIILQKPKGAQGEFEEYTFSSESDDVATVTANGLIKAIDDGETIITILGSISETTKTINVKVNGKIPVADCDVTVQSSTLEEGVTEQIKINKPVGRKGKIEPVTYSSSNTDIATVDENGQITAVAGGNATITVLGSKSGTSKTIAIIVKREGVFSLSELSTSELGDYVDLGTDIVPKNYRISDNTFPKADWRVFNKTLDGTLLILASNLKQNVLPAETGLTLRKEPYSFGNVSIANLNSENWKNLIIVNESLYNNLDVIVKGAPTLQEWADSWNQNEGYRNLTVSGSLVNGSTNDVLLTQSGFNNALYFPLKGTWNASTPPIGFSYWLATSGGDSYGNTWWYIDANGKILCRSKTLDSISLRPVVFIPSSLYE